MSHLQAVSFFKDLGPAQLAKVAESLEPAEFVPGAPIITMGDVGDCFYILRAGTVVVTDDRQAELCRIGAGGHFGERALLSDDVRAAHITVAPDSRPALVYTLQRDAFRAALAMAEETFRMGALSGLRELAPLCASGQLGAVCAAMTHLSLEPGAQLLQAGVPLDGLYLVEEGSLEGGAAPIRRGCAFGAASLLSAGEAAPAALSAAADAPAKLLRLAKAEFEKLFGSLEDCAAASRLAALRRVPLLASLPSPSLAQLARELAPLSAPPGTKVVKAGERGDTFFLVEAGCLAVLDAHGAEVAQLAEGAYFGEMALESEDALRHATVVVPDKAAPAQLLVMTRAAFRRLREASPAFAAGLKAGEAAYAPLPGEEVPPPTSLADVTLRRALGVGTFGKVYLCAHGGRQYALKSIAKAQVVRKGLVTHVKRERDVMAECASTPFLVQLAASFQDDQHLYLMMELVTGGELFYYLQSLGEPLAEAHARFYCACVVEAFAFLHSRYYIYRDLKPENLLLTASGYLKMADFSFVKRLRGGKTATLCGTPAYLAPEQISRAGHDRAVDWWALGVLTYEMLAGQSPFYADDDMVMFRRIVDVKYSYATPGASRMSPGARDLVSNLLVKAPQARLPMRSKGVPGLRDAAWFKGFAWDQLRSGAMKAPYVPKGADDLRFFPDVGEEENPGAEYGRYTSVGNFAGF